MKNLTLALIALVFVAVSSALAAAQQPVEAGFPGLSQVEGSRPDTQDVFELVLRDGSRLFGRVERESSQEVVFQTTTGSTITASRAESCRSAESRDASRTASSAAATNIAADCSSHRRHGRSSEGRCLSASFSSSRRSSRSASPTVFQWAVARP